MLNADTAVTRRVKSIGNHTAGSSCKINLGRGRLVA